MILLIKKNNAFQEYLINFIVIITSLTLFCISGGILHAENNQINMVSYIKV